MDAEPSDSDIKAFSWTMNEHTSQKMQLQINLDNSDSVSPVDQDILQIEVSNTEIFTSEDGLRLEK